MQSAWLGWVHHGDALTPSELIAFEARVARAFEAGEVKGPVHLSGGNEEVLLKIFQDVAKNDWVFTSYRNHYHALLHGLPSEWLMSEIRAGRSMYISDPARKLMSSAIVAGCIPIAVGAAAAIKRRQSKERVWCFVGDMAATTGTFFEALQYSFGHELPIKFVIEDNGFSCDSPTGLTWGRKFDHQAPHIIRYQYKRVWPHVGTGKFVKFPGF